LILHIGIALQNRKERTSNIQSGTENGIDYLMQRMNLRQLSLVLAFDGQQK
jgi:hypothetical protein